MAVAVYRARDLLLVPNLLSAARVPLAVVFPFAASSPAGALGVLGAAGMTDVLDGWTARKLGQATPMGALVDGIADKVFAGSVLGSLVGAGVLSPVTALLLATRELLELPLALRIVLSPKARLLERDRGANRLGKLATTLELASVVAAVVRAPGTRLLVAATALVGVAAGASYWLREIDAARHSTRTPVIARSSSAPRVRRSRAAVVRSTPRFDPPPSSRGLPA